MSTAFRVQSIPIEMNGKIYGILKIGTPALGSLNLTWEMVFVLELARVFLIIQDKNPIQGGCAERTNERETGFFILGATRTCHIIFNWSEEERWFYRLLENM